MAFPVTSVLNGFPVTITNKGGWSVISNNPGKYGSRQTSRQTSRVECVPVIDVDQVRLIYGNWYTSGVGENSNTNPIRVRASIQPQAATIDDNAQDGIYRVTFGGKDYTMIGRGAWAISDPIPTKFLANQRFFVKSYADATFPSAPAAPTAAISGTGGGLGVGTYGVSITIVYPDGVESAASTSTSVVVASTGQNIQVTSPSSVVGAIGYRIWFTMANGSLTGNHYDSGAGVLPFGTNYLYTLGILTSSVNSVEQVDPTGALYIPVGLGVLGGSVNAGASNNGEAKNDGFDRTGEGRIVRGTQAAFNVFAPCAILGWNDNIIAPSVAVIGDSIATATSDNGFGYQRGGFMVRTILNQLDQPAYNPNIPPLMGHVVLSQGAEQAAQFSGTAGFKRSLIGYNCTHVWSNYGTNDLGSAASTIISYLIIIGNRFINVGKTFIQSDILPRASSTDGWVTLDNQRIVSPVTESNRRMVNNWIASPDGEVVKTDVPLFRHFAATVAPTYNLYGGGDGSILTFYAQDVFKQGTETVKINGVTQTLTTNYSYTGSQVIDGVSYATGFLFTSAPANNATVTASYTTIKGMRSYLGEKSKYMPTAISISINGSGLPDRNGGFTKLSDSVPLVAPRAATSTMISGLDDTTQNWTQDQFRGYSVMITADASTPAAVGQVLCIQYNTATTIRSNTQWVTQPSSTATYKIFKSYQTDSIHPSSFGHIEMAKASDLTLFT